MNRSILAVALSSLLFAAAPAPAPAQQTAPASKPGAAAKDKTPRLAEFDQQAAQVQEHIKKMQEQMEKISKTQDPQERQKLLQEHWADMQGSMGIMRGMWGPGMMGCCGAGPMMGGHMMGGGPGMRWRGMGHYYSRLTPEQMKQRQYMMDQYMGLQHQMMDHMMRHQNYMWTQPAK